MTFDLPPSCEVAIVGAGAAGLATAIFARRFNPSRPVILLDGARKPGAKILVSGGARCNVTNAVVTERDFWGGPSPIVRRVLRALPVPDTIAFFRGIGVNLHEEAGGKLFPDSNRARDVLEALLGETATVGARLVAGCRVLDVEPSTRADRSAPSSQGDEQGFRVITARGEIHASTIVLATGGLSLPKTGSDGAGLAIAERLGHTIVRTTPALAPLVLAGDAAFHRGLSGVSHDAELALWIDGAVAIRLRGALLWTHFGVSGPVALNASRHLLRAQLDDREVSITISFCPGRQFDDVDGELVRLAGEHPKAMLQTMLATLVPGSVAAALLRGIGIDGSVALAHVGRRDRRRLAGALVEWPLPAAGTRGYTFAEATAGGVALTEIDPSTMESRVCRGLFLVGEMLDIDGRIGGFNFQWAWSSGFVAGRALSAISAES